MELRVKQIKEDLKRFRKNKKVFKRLSVLLESTRYKHLCTTLVKYQITERTFYRWKKRYVTQGAVGLLDRSGRGKKKIWIRGRLAKRIKQMRKQNQWGAEVIQAHLKLDHHVTVSQGRINRFLKDQGLIIPAKKHKAKSKHTKVVLIIEPGKHTQIDVKHVTHIKAGKKRYMYNFVDHASKWSFKKSYDSYGPFETKCFMQAVVAKTPFRIESIQSDNGIEFTNKFISDPVAPKEHALDVFCRENNIYHKLIPVGEKELNGLVEKHHHLDFKECYRHLKTLDLKQINTELERYCIWRNAHRRYKALGWKTPNEYLRYWRQAKASKNNTSSFENLVDIYDRQVA